MTWGCDAVVRDDEGRVWECLAPSNHVGGCFLSQSSGPEYDPGDYGRHVDVTKSTAPPKDTVLDVWKRDEGSCARCGRSLSFEGRGMYWSLHHRTPRGSGGTKAPWINLASNLILLCGSGTTGCHGHIEKNRRQAEDDGLIVRHGIRLPADIPVQHTLYGLIWLTDHGTVSTRPPGDRL